MGMLRASSCAPRQAKNSSKHAAHGGCVSSNFGRPLPEPECTLVSSLHCSLCSTHHNKPPCAACCSLLLQRVVYRGEEMPASRFEVLAGKPDAKKWKTSLNFVGSDGGPAEVSGGPRGGAGAQRGGSCQPPCTPGSSIEQTTCLPKDVWQDGCQHAANPHPPLWSRLPVPPAPRPYVLLLPQMMQEWLAARQLDRKALDALARNVAQIQAWHLYTQSQGGAAGGQAGCRGRAGRNL